MFGAVVSREAYCSCSERESSIVLLRWVQHPELHSDLSVRIGDDRVGEFVGWQFAIILNVLDPRLVRLHGVAGDGNNLHVAFCELWHKFSNSTQFGGTHRSEIGRVREQDTPAKIKDKTREANRSARDGSIDRMMPASTREVCRWLFLTYLQNNHKESFYQLLFRIQGWGKRLRGLEAYLLVFSSGMNLRVSFPGS